MKNGKKPIEAKSAYLTPSAIFGGSELELTPEVAEYLRKNDLGHKWLSTAHLKKNGGRHKRGWVPFKLPEELKQASPTNPFSNSTGDYLEVGDLVLGVKPMRGTEVSVENHKRYLKQEVRLATMEALGTDGKGNALVNVEE